MADIATTTVSQKNNAAAAVAKTPFCKVCKDAGKSEEEYTSHYVRAGPEKDACVVCPTLLSQECAYCHELGHTKKYCPKLKEKMARMKRNQTNSRDQTRNNRAANMKGFFTQRMNPHEHDLYRQCLGLGIPADALLRAFTAPRVSTQDFSPVTSPNLGSVKPRGFSALSCDDDHSEHGDNSGPTPADNKISDDWTKMSHASALRRERELTEAKEEAERMLQASKESHRQEIERLNQALLTPLTIPELERQLQDARDKAVVESIEGASSSNNDGGKKKKRGGKKKKKMVVTLAGTNNTNSDGQESPTNSTKSEPITLTITETNAKESAKDDTATIGCDVTDSILASELFQGGNSTRNWYEDSDDESDN